MDIVMVGDRYLTSLFRMVGIDVVEAEDEDSAVAKVQKIVDEESPKILFITEKVALRLKELREELLKEKRFYPVFVIIPDFEGTLGKRKEELREFVNKSMGVKLKVGD
jgi:vacuolar-type H+-ATPase subunit F/Vma7